MSKEFCGIPGNFFERIRKMTTYAYYRVSTDEQDYNNQKQGVLKLAENMNLVIEAEVVDNGKSGSLPPEKRQLGQLLGAIKQGDIIIAAELSRLSRKLFDMFQIAKYLNDKGVKLYTVKDNYNLDGSIQGQILLFAFGLAAQIERDMISQRTKEALARKKQEGVKIGRPRTLKYRKLDVYADYIKQSIQNKIPLSAICRKVGCDWSTLQRWSKENGFKTYGRNVKLEPRKNKTACYNVDYSKSYVEQVNKSLVCSN